MLLKLLIEEYKSMRKSKRKPVQENVVFHIGAPYPEGAIGAIFGDHKGLHRVKSSYQMVDSSRV